MVFSLIPDRVFSCVLDIEAAYLAERGITLLLADLDNTLARYGQREPDGKIREWERALRESGITLFVLSNSRRPARVTDFAQDLGVPFLGHAGKPKTSGFFAAMEQMGRRPEETAMVGDQLFTDILGAKRAGVPALMVEPIDLRGNPGRYLRYAVEEPFRALGRRRSSWRDRKGK